MSLGYKDNAYVFTKCYKNVTVSIFVQQENIYTKKASNSNTGTVGTEIDAHAVCLV